MVKNNLPPAVAKKTYIHSINRGWIYGILGLLVAVVAFLVLLVPHDKPLRYASATELNDAHHQVISQYFLASTTCTSDNVAHAQRVLEFTKYLKVNQFANRAVVRGCNDNDSLLYKADDGRWQRSDVNITLNTRQNPVWQKACLIDDISTADTVMRPENSSIDSNNLRLCNQLRRQSYVELSIHFHF